MCLLPRFIFCAPPFRIQLFKKKSRHFVFLCPALVFYTLFISFFIPCAKNVYL